MDPSSASDDSNHLATVCHWQSTDRTTQATLSLNVNTSFDLIYLSKDVVQGFAEFTLKGFPAVREVGPGSSTCTTYVRIAKTQVFSLETGTREPGLVTPCRLADALAADVIDSLSSHS
jgi:hypothetical protein